MFKVQGSNTVYRLNKAHGHLIDTMNSYEFMYSSIQPNYKDNLLVRSVIHDVALNLFLNEKPMMNDEKILRNPLNTLFLDTVMMFEQINKLRIYTVDHLEHALFSSVVLVNRILIQFDNVFNEMDFTTQKLLWDSFYLDVSMIFDIKYEKMGLYPKQLLIAQTLIGKKLKKKIIDDYSFNEQNIREDILFLEEVFFIEKKLFL